MGLWLSVILSSTDRKTHSLFAILPVRVQEKGQGSASDMVRRKIVRQTSERDVGMFDMLLPTPMAEIT